MTLPSPIQAYFDADRRSDGEALIRAFTPDAAAVDEGQSHAGHQAIGAWWRETKARYQSLIEPLGAAEEGDITKVRASVSGAFPGSPVTLTFAFHVERDLIAGLEIGA